MHHHDSLLFIQGLYSSYQFLEYFCFQTNETVPKVPKFGYLKYQNMGSLICLKTEIFKELIAPGQMLIL